MRAMTSSSKKPHQPDLLRRLRRIEGQIQGVSRMIETNRYCVDILTQVGAIQAALDSVALRLLEDHTQGCVRGAIRSGKGEKEITELMTLFRQFLR